MFRLFEEELTVIEHLYLDREVEPAAMQKLGDDAKSEMIAQTFGDVGELIDGEVLCMHSLMCVQISHFLLRL